MKNGIFGLALSLLLAAPAMGAISIDSFTGTLRIKVGKRVTTVKAGERAPAVPAGAEVTIVSGEAQFAVDGAVLKADAGDSFKLAPSRSGARLVVTAGSLVLIKEGRSISLASGQSMLVTPADAPPSLPAQTASESLPQSSPVQEKQTSTVSPSSP